MSERSLKISTGKPMPKSSIFTEDKSVESSEEEGSGPWKTARKTKRTKSCKDCSGCTSQRPKSKGRAEKEQHQKQAEGNFCKGNIHKACGKPVLNDAAGGIACDICMEWYHPSCQDLGDEIYNMLRKANLVWLCLHCRNQLPKIRNLLRTTMQDSKTETGSQTETSLLGNVEVMMKEQLQVQKKEIEDTVLSCTARLEKTMEETTKLMMLSAVNRMEDTVVKSGHKVIGEVGNKLDTAVEAQLNGIEHAEKVIGKSVASLENLAVENHKASQTLPRITADMKSTTDKVVRIIESQADDQRKKNVVIHNLQESRSDDPEERKQEDKKSFSFMMSALFGDHHKIRAERVIRLGKPDASSSKPRLLLVTVEGREQVEQIYKRRFGLKEAGLENIYITRDLPPAEREKQRKLRKELAEKGKGTHCIFRGSVICKEDGPWANKL